MNGSVGKTAALAPAQGSARAISLRKPVSSNGLVQQLRPLAPSIVVQHVCLCPNGLVRTPWRCLMRVSATFYECAGHVQQSLGTV